MPRRLRPEIASSASRTGAQHETFPDPLAVTERQHAPSPRGSRCEDLPPSAIRDLGRMTDATSPNASGIALDDASRKCVVPQSIRADGSIRRERKVKPGYTPIEDVPRFHSQRVEAKKAQTGAPRGNAVRAALGLEPPRPPSPSSSDASSSPRRLGHAPLPRSRADSMPRWEHDAYLDRPASSFSSRYAPSPQSSPARKSSDMLRSSPGKKESPERPEAPAKGRIVQKVHSPEQDRTPRKTQTAEKERRPEENASPGKTRTPGKVAVPSAQRSPAARPGSAGSKYAPSARVYEQLGPSPLSPSPKRRPHGDSPRGSYHRRQCGRGRGPKPGPGPGRHDAQASAGSAPAPLPNPPEAALPPPIPSSPFAKPGPLAKQASLSLSDWAEVTGDWADEDEDDLFSADGFKLPGISGSISTLPQATNKGLEETATEKGTDADGLTRALGKMNVA